MILKEFLKSKIRGSINLNQLIKDGLIVGNNFNAAEGTIIDPGHCWLIEIGDNVTLGPRTQLIAHDASMKKVLGYTKIGKITIGNNCFVGAGTVILPNVEIDDNTIVGAGSVVSKSLKGGGVFLGVPAQKICEYDTWIEKHKESIKKYPCFDNSYKIGNISGEKKNEMKELLGDNIGYII